MKQICKKKDIISLIYNMGEKPLEIFFSSIDDIIDILLVSYVIYKLLMIVKGTRAIQLLKGIMIIIIAWLISTYFELKTFQWLMSQAFTYGVLAIIIIFQPELRRALEKLGSGKILMRHSNLDEGVLNKIADEIVKSVLYLSKRRIGALIVIEREIGLTDYIESGTIINADMNSQLLINIFTPNAPLHDGAVIIRRDKILAAACYLPLTENAYVSKELGTRHRAALGMSDVSDALTVISSEETGIISITKNGNIIRGFNEEKLKNIILSELSPLNKNSTGPFWRKRWRKNG